MYPLVSIITVNFNQPDLTEELLHSLQKISYPNVEVLVVDNGCEQDCSHLQQRFPAIRFLKSSRNLGFAGGNNLAIRQAQGEYILLLNNDTEVDPGFLEPMIDLYNHVPELGIVSPLIIYYGKNQIQYAGATSINLFNGRGRKLGHKKPIDKTYEQAYPTALGHGAAMLFPARLINEIGLLPEEYFLYYEEHDWSEACKRAGYRIFFQGTSKVYHKESATTGSASPLKTYYLNRNRLLFIKRNARGYQKYIAILFFLLLAFPKNMLGYLLAGKWAHARALWAALHWHVHRPHHRLRAPSSLAKNQVL